ncbi:MAG: TMEM175 family protein [Dokdonella sp.]
MSDPAASILLDSARRDDDGFRDRGGEVTRAEAFFDAAFAFAVTLMVISIDEIPKSSAELLLALKSIPAFGASFLLITLFWRGHSDWSRRFGLNDRYSQRLALALVFLVLIFVYPLRMVFSSFFSWITDGALPADLRFAEADDVRLMFLVFAVAFGSMGAMMVALYRHAWSQRNAIGLDPVETLGTRYILLRWLMLPVFSLISIGLTVSIPEMPGQGWLLALPGLVFFGLHVLQALIGQRHRRTLAQLRST